MLYDLYTGLLEPQQLRRFYTEAEDWSALRRMDNLKLDEGDMSTGAVN